VEKHLKRFRLDAYFSVIKTKDDVREVKPDPELYLRVLEALRLKPEEAVAIEDSVNGSTAALRAGIPCYIIPNRVTKGSRFPEQAVVLDDFCRIPLADLLDA
jgi:putative hydrolase of the HAD superfamily